MRTTSTRVEVGRPVSRVLGRIWSYTVVYCAAVAAAMAADAILAVMRSTPALTFHEGGFLGAAIAPLYFCFRAVPATVWLDMEPGVTMPEAESMLISFMQTAFAGRRLYRGGIEIQRDGRRVRLFPRRPATATWIPFPRQGFWFKYVLDWGLSYVYLEHVHSAFRLVGPRDVLMDFARINQWLRLAAVPRNDPSTSTCGG